MNKQQELSTVNGNFTTDTLRDIFSTVHKSENVHLTGWKIDDGSVKGDNYLSTVCRVEAEAVVDGKSRNIKLFVKSLPTNLGRQRTFRNSEFFANEIRFYSRVVPKMKEFVLSKEKDHLLAVPRCLAFMTNGKNDYLVLEDVSPLGFDRVCRDTCVDIGAAEIILKTMARFHAVSFAFKDQMKDEFETIRKELKETYFRPDLWNWYKRFHAVLVRLAKDALSREYPNSTAEKRFLAYNHAELYERCTELCDRADAPTSIITQGDAWPPNFLVRQHGPNKKEAIMLDFQLAHCTSPVLDLAFFVYSCTNRSLRDNHFDNMLRIYHNELVTSIRSLGSDPETLYPWKTFMQEVKEQFIYGVTFAMEAVPFTLLDESQSFDLDVIIKDEKGVDIADVWTLSNIESKEGRQRLADVIVHAVDNGFL